jgi:hypothetical protein
LMTHKRHRRRYLFLIGFRKGKHRLLGSSLTAQPL